jgi:hypothetical protein
MSNKNLKENEPETVLTVKQQMVVEEMKELYETNRRNGTARDNTIVTLSSALLALSISFSDKIGLSDATFFWLVPIAWLSWGLAIYMIIRSYRRGEDESTAHLMWIKSRSDNCDDENKKRADWTKINEKVSKINHQAADFFVAGVVFFIFFAIVNTNPIKQWINANQKNVPATLQKCPFGK